MNAFHLNVLKLHCLLIKVENTKPRTDFANLITNCDQSTNCFKPQQIAKNGIAKKI